MIVRPAICVVYGPAYRGHWDLAPCHTVDGSFVGFLPRLCRVCMFSWLGMSDLFGRFSGAGRAHGIQRWLHGGGGAEPGRW